MAENSEEICVGIDLGTTNSVAAIYFMKKEETEVIHNVGNRLTRSCVFFKNEDQEVVGRINEALKKPANFIFSAKRFMGKSFKDPSIKEDIEKVPFKVVEGEKGNAAFSITYTSGKEKLYWPQEIGARVLGSLKKATENFLGKSVKNAVITVPAYFGDQQIQATKEAGEIAGFNVLRVLAEPTAAALAYGLKNKSEKSNILVFDLGGGTFDVSVLTADGPTIDVKAIGGDVHLGGDDWDYTLFKYVCDDLKAKQKPVPNRGSREYLMLLEECRKIKELLSDNQSWTHEFESIEDYTKLFTRNQLEKMTKGYFDKCLEIVTETLERAKIPKEKIDEVLLVGGSTKMPKVREILREYFGKEPCGRINPDEIVAIGAAIQGAALVNKSNRVGTPLENVAVFDRTPISYGVEIMGKEMSIILKRDSPVPIENSNPYRTVMPFQTTIQVNIYQGENKLTANNELIASFDISNIPPRMPGELTFLIKFKIDVNRILCCEVTCLEDANIAKTVTLNLNQKGSMAMEKRNEAKDDLNRTSKLAEEREKKLAINTEIENNMERLKKLIRMNSEFEVLIKKVNKLNNQESDLSVLNQLNTEVKSWFIKNNLPIEEPDLFEGKSGYGNK